MTDPRTVQVQHPHAKIDKGGYRVDSDAVAEALLRRLLAGRALECPGTR
jgi:hypothetical protein